MMRLRPSLLALSLVASIVPATVHAYVDPESVLLEKSFQQLFEENPPWDTEERAYRQNADYQAKHDGNPALKALEEEEALHAAAGEEEVDLEPVEETSEQRRNARFLLRKIELEEEETLHGAAPGKPSPLSSGGEVLEGKGKGQVLEGKGKGEGPLSQTGPGLIAGLLLAIAAVGYTLKIAAGKMQMVMEEK